MLGAFVRAPIFPAAAENAGRLPSEAVPTCGQLGSTAPHQVHRRRRHLRRRHSRARMAGMDHVARECDEGAYTEPSTRPPTPAPPLQAEPPTVPAPRSPACVLTVFLTASLWQGQLAGYARARYGVPDAREGSAYICCAASQEEGAAGILPAVRCGCSPACCCDAVTTASVEAQQRSLRRPLL